MGNGQPATAGRVLLSGLTIRGSVSPQESAPTYYMYNCVVQNNTLAGIIPGTALYAVPNTRVYVQNCSFTSNSTVNSTVFVQSDEFTLKNSSVKMTSVNPAGGPSAPTAPVFGHSYGISAGAVPFLIIDGSEISTAYGFTLNNSPLVRFNSSTSGNRTIVEITNSTLRYDSTQVASVPTEKVCVRVESPRIIEITVANCLLLQPGGAPDSIRSIGTTTLTYGNNLGFNGKNAKAVQTAVALQTMA